MGRKLNGVWIVFCILALTVSLAVGLGCSREQPSQPATSSAPATVAQPVQPAPAPPVTPSGPTTAAPAAPATPATSPSAVAPAGPPSAAQITVGMTSDQVLQILGNPAKVEQEGQYTEWKYYTPQGKIEVYFSQNNRVAYVKQK